MNSSAPKELWESVLGELQSQVNQANFKTWFRPTIGLNLEDGCFTIGVPNTFIAEYLDQSQRSLIERVLSNHIGLDTTVRFQVEACAPVTVNPRRKEAPPQQMGLPGFNDRYTFDKFVIGSGNRMAHAASKAVIDEPGHNFNPLFIYGDSGLGKTHLLHAIGHEAQNRKLKVLYASAERFTNEFVQAVRLRATEEFHQKYRSVDMLLIDDIHFISGKEGTEESFFHTFNELHDSNRQIVLTSNQAPGAIKNLETRLQSRFTSGLTVDIQPPDVDTRKAILHAKTDTLGTELPDDVVNYIAGRNVKSVRDLEGSLNRVMAYSKLVRSAPTIDMSVQALNNIGSCTPATTTASPAQIMLTVAQSFNLTPDDLCGRKRDNNTALARQIAMYIVRAETNYSLAQIGAEFGGRDHSTVIHACEKILAVMDSSPHLKRRIQDIRQEIGCVK